MIVWLASLAWAQEGCEKVGLSDVTDIEAPAILVLGERHGTQPDLSRARKIIRSLRAEAHVTVALEAVHEKFSPVLKDFSESRIATEALETELDWTNSWGFPYQPYESILTAAVYGDTIVAAGPNPGPPPKDAAFPVPSGYFSVLSTAMAGHEVPPEMQKDFVRSVAWRDWKIADNALAGWDQTGYLVVLASRVHVEGGKGIGWQLQQRTQVPVRSVVLAWANSPCFAGDWVWAPTIAG